MMEKWIAANPQTMIYHRARRAQAGPITRSHDIFGCLDFLVILKSGDMYGTQVTTQSGLTARRRKIEAIAWPFPVFLATHERVPDAADRRKVRDYWRRQTYYNGRWTEPEAIRFDRAADNSSWRQKA